MFLSRHASNPDNLALLQAHLDSVCTGMLDKIVPLTRQQQMNTDLDDDYATHEPDDDLSIEHMRACREPPTHAPGPAIQTHPGGTLSGSPEEMLTGASFSRNKHSCVAAATPTPEVATSLPTDVGEVETTPTERTTSDIAKRARDCGVETTDVGRPIQKGVDDTEERIPDLVGEPPSKRKTSGSRKKVTKGGSSRQIKVGDHVSCASTEFDGSEPGSWSAGQEDRMFGTVTRISKEGAVMVHWDDDNTYFAVKMKSLKRETAVAADRPSLLPTTGLPTPKTVGGGDIGHDPWHILVLAADFYCGTETGDHRRSLSLSRTTQKIRRVAASVQRSGTAVSSPQVCSPLSGRKKRAGAVFRSVLP